MLNFFSTSLYMNISSIDYIKFINNFPEIVKNINLKTLDNEKLKSINMESLSLIYQSNSSNKLFYKIENELYLINSDLGLGQKFFPSDADEIKEFGYSNYTINKHDENYLVISGFTKSNEIFLYFYKNDNKTKLYELDNKVVLSNIVGSFYSKFVNNHIFIVQIEEFGDDSFHLNLLKFSFNNEDIKLETKLKFEVDSEEVLISISNKHLFIFNKILYIIDLSINEVIEKIEITPIFMDSFEINNNYLTFISTNERVAIFDEHINIRQIIELENISEIQLEESYLMMFNKEKSEINIYALDHNGIFTNFAIYKKDNISSVYLFNQKLIINIKEVGNELIELPKRIFNFDKFNGYGFSSEIEKKYGDYILINNGKLSTFKNKDSLLIGYSDRLSDIIFENKSIFIKSNHVDNTDGLELSKDFIILSENHDFEDYMLNINKSNFLFIEKAMIDIYLQSTKGSSLMIKNEEKIITWEKDGVMKLTILENVAMLELITKCEINILGYIERKNSSVFDYSVTVVSEENDVTINDILLNDHQTFFPYINSNSNFKIEGLVNKKIENLNLDLDLLPVKVNMANYSLINNIQLNNLNQRFYRRYLIENNNKSIQVTDLLSKSKIVDYKVNDLTGIKKIIYANPILVILSKPENDIDTLIHLFNTKNNNIIPYSISNNNNENLLNFLIFHSNTLIFVTENSGLSSSEKTIYIVSLDDKNEISEVKKVKFQEDIKDIKLFESFMVVESLSEEVIIYDINICQAIVSLTDTTLISFDIIYNNIILLLKQEELVINVYEIKPNFELINEKKLQYNDDILSVNLGPGKIILNYKNFVEIYDYDKFNNISKIDKLDGIFIHYYKNILVLMEKNTENSNYLIYQFSPEVIYSDNHVTCKAKFNNLKITGVENQAISLFFKVYKNLDILLNDSVIIKKVTKNYSIVKITFDIKKCQEILIESANKNTFFCGIILGEIKEKLPCFLPGTLIQTPEGLVPIENLEENDIIFNEFNEEVKISRVKSWSTSVFNDNVIPYIIPKDSLQQDYPIEDTYVSPFHQIKLPNGEYKCVYQINLPMIKKFIKYDDSKLLKYKDLILDKVNYYNFILPDNSNFIANGMVVESLNKNNKN